MTDITLTRRPATAPPADGPGIAPGAVSGPSVRTEAPARPVRVGLMGFGRTGRDVARAVLADPSVSLVWAARRSDRLERQPAAEVLGVESSDGGVIHAITHADAAELLGRDPVDVVIDFSSAEGLDYYGQAAADRGVAIVTAVSAYPEAQQRRLARLAESTPVLWSPNITLGINFLLLAAQALQRIAPAADVQVTEEHFRGKKEVSGTALRLARALGTPHDAVHVTRAGGIIGVHEVLFGMRSQVVRLRHESISREAFGEGAIFAAGELVGREAGLYRMEDLLAPYFPMADAAAMPPARTPGVRGRIVRGLRAAAVRLEG